MSRNWTMREAATRSEQSESPRINIPATEVVRLDHIDFKFNAISKLVFCQSRFAIFVEEGLRILRKC